MTMPAPSPCPCGSDGTLVHAAVLISSPVWAQQTEGHLPNYKVAGEEGKRAASILNMLQKLDY